MARERQGCGSRPHAWPLCQDPKGEPCLELCKPCLHGLEHRAAPGPAEMPVCIYPVAASAASSHSTGSSSRHNKLLITLHGSDPEVYFYPGESAIYLSIEASKGKSPGATYKQNVAPGDGVPGS
jgi:hypothetical protein